MNKVFYFIIACLLGVMYLTFVPEDEQEIKVEHPKEFATQTNSQAYEIPILAKERAEILLEQYGYTVSYNPDLCIPNWVAWELNAEKLVERESRNSKFVPNPKLPEDMAVTTKEYTGSGWDRGHMCPAGDNKYHWRAMNECFYMTNICPQNHSLNSGDWKELEE
ncbi:MAG: DNA/RNA non-specific endonuclease, partial [Bacteroidaceae bacterium]|nr:DNA/RNA non-specific endonuclease [Bacteroidaceae bacterium]